MADPTRTVALRNAHPRLRVPRGAVDRVVRLLDEQFTLHAADLPHLVLPPARRAALKRAFRPGVAQVRAGCPPGELSIVLVTDRAIARLHADFMDDPTATDVITFEGDPLAGLAGEICVSADTARQYAREHGRDFAEELTLYIVHGWLHLAGYDDLRPARKRRKRAAEARALALLRAAAAIPAFRLTG